LWWLAAAAITATCSAHALLFTFNYFQGVSPTGASRVAERVLPWGHRAIYVLALAALVGMVVRVSRLAVEQRRGYFPFAIGLGVLAVPTLNSLYADASVVLAVGILRDGVLDIEVALRRTTVYTVLAAAGAGTYVGTVALFSLFLQRGSGAGPEIATGLIAVGALPAHAWVERFVAQRVFGNRARPYEVVTALGARLSQSPPGDQALQLVADTLAAQLRLPFVAVEVAAGDVVVEAARWGKPGPPVERFPLIFQGEHLGALVVAHRSDREPFGTSERELLSAFASQSGVIAHNAALAQALLRSRLLLVQTREDERRRIRRDLHDGLGPTLATVSLGLGAAAERLQDDVELSALLHDLEGEVDEAIADIRRLIYELRPPTLDELGLVRALRLQAGQLAARTDSSSAVAIAVSAPTADLDVPSAVELAAYRVALEAMTNVVRHAHATSCWVAVERAQDLVLRVEDDGIGIADDAPRGVGMRSMRERAIELGGSLRIEPRVPRGTTVQVNFPLLGLS
jgi:signal transduction histidine kinase